jgi:hypothetical protein
MAMAHGIKADMVFGLIKTVRRLLPLLALQQRLQQSLSTAKYLSVLLLWLPALVNESSKALLRRLQAARQALAQSLSSVLPRQSVDHLRLQQALSALLKAPRKLLSRLRQVLPPSLSQALLLPPHLHQVFRSLVGSFKAQVHQLQPFHRLPQTAKLSGRKSRQPLIAGLTKPLHPQHIHNSLMPALAGNRQREG